MSDKNTPSLRKLGENTPPPPLQTPNENISEQAEQVISAAPEQTGQVIAPQASKLKTPLRLKNRALPSELKAQAEVQSTLQELDETNFQNCPNCQEQIPAENILCHHCSYNLETGKFIQTKIIKAKTQKADSYDYSAGPSESLGSLASVCFTTGLAAIFGSCVWAGIAAATGYSIGWLAIGIGFVVGLAAQFRGDGTAAIIAACMAVLSVATGTYLGACAIISQTVGIGFFDCLGEMGVSFELMKEITGPKDILFYILAMATAFKGALK